MPASDLLSSAYFGTPATHVPTDIFDVAEDRLSQVFRNDMDSPIGTDYYLRIAEEGRAFSERNDLIKQRFGRDVVQEVREEFPQAGADFLITEYQKRTDQLIEEGRTQDMNAWAGIRKAEEIEAVTVDRAQVAEIEAQRTTSRAESSFAAIGGNLMGGLGEIIDPINILTLPLGAGAGRGIIKAAMTDGVINMGVEAVQSPSRAEWMRDIGFKYGFEEIAADIATAGVGGAALSGLIRGVGKGLNKLSGQSETILRTIADDTANGAEVRDAAKYMERVAQVDENIPPLSRIDDGMNPHEVVATHRANVQETQEAFRNYREPVYADDIPFDAGIVSGKGISPRAKSDLENPTSFVIKNKKTGEVIMETFSRDVAEKINKEKYEAVPIIEHLANLNKQSFYKPVLVNEKISADLIDFAPNDPSIKTAKKRSKQFIEAVKSGAELPPVRLIKKIDGRFEVYDGNARVMAYKEAGVDIPKYILQPSKSELPATDKIKVQEVADPYLEPMPNAAARLADDVKAGAEDNMMDAARADFERMVDEMPDYEILMEDGSTRSIKELAEELAEDGKILEAVTVCGVG